MGIRLFVDVVLDSDLKVVLTDNQHHYLAHVMRSQVGDNVLLFNGKDGEWKAVVEEISKKKTFLRVLENTRLQSEEKLSDVWLCFSPIKKDNMELIIQKTTELGVRVLQPVMMHRTVAGKINTEKMRLQAIEAAEQCERLSLPLINEPITLDHLLKTVAKDRKFYFLDERGEGASFNAKGKTAYLVGPEGGFDVEELKKLRSFEFATPLHLGRRILRAETACIAVLSVHNHLSGWT